MRDNHRAWYDKQHELRFWNDKEWWFSYVIDRRSMLYLSWTFFRAFYSDYFACFACDAVTGRRWSLQKICRIDSSSLHEGLRLEKSGRDFAVLFQMQAGQGSLHLAAGDHRIDLLIQPSVVPPFSKYEDQFRRHYGFEHRYKHSVSGTIAFDGMERTIDSNYSYFDHCFGNVPRRTGWHWIALQNEALLLTSLVNYGPYAQRYTQVHAGGAWERLDQNVAFEHDRGDQAGEWRITSADMDLDLILRGSHRKITRIPPFLPFAVSVDHRESFVEAAGRIRINGSWQNVRELMGVMEEHHGWW